MSNNKLLPPAAIQRGRKDVQYFPRECSQADCIGLVLADVIKAGGTLEIKAWDKVETALQDLGQHNLRLLIWQPVAKDNLGDVAFDGLGRAISGKGSRYLQIVEGPQQNESNVITMPSPEQPKPVQ